MKTPSKTSSRERVLTDAELKAIWNAATDFPYGTIVRLLILTGQRRGEIAGLKWPYITGNCITVPRTKNGRAHTYPIGSMAQAIIEKVPRLNSTVLLFPSRALTTPFNAWSRYKTALDERSGVSEWTLHDLRRTFATNLASLSVPIHVVEKLLNHASGTISGVAAIYNRFTYAEEMRAAVSNWERRLVSLLTDQAQPHELRAA